MQNSELFRRGIVLPLDPEAEESLRINDVNESAAFQYLEIPDQPFFETLWALGLFQTINAKSGSMIDDYEEEFVEPAAITHVLQAVDEVRSRAESPSTETLSFLNQLYNLAQESKKLNRPILFVL
ncbi:MAG: hypothetical protein JW829_07330 [Pirellulales bacterium]|nr:hypothetical protein [Pirellulales bacterium]